jgi:uncharacterized RDD family membrane protein YckC
MTERFWTWLSAASLALAVGATTSLPLQAAEDEDREDSPPAKEEPGPVERPEAHEFHRELVNVFSSSELKAGDRVAQAVTVFGDANLAGEVENQCVTVFGNAKVDGNVAGQCVVVFGDLDLNSSVGGQVVVFAGDARLGPKAAVGGELIVVGGKLQADPAAKITGQKIEVGGFLSGLGEWFRSGLLLGRPIAPGVWWVWVIVALHFLFYLIIAAVAPRPVEACERALRTQPVACFGVGLLAMILSGPLIAILVATGVGILVVPFVWLGFKVAGWLGKTAVFPWMGRGLLGRFMPGRAGSLLGSFLVGFLLVTLLYLVPFIGFIVWGLLLPLSLGAGLMAAVEAMRQSRANKAAAATSGVSGSAGISAGGAAGATLAVAAVGGAEEYATMPRAGFWLRTAATALDFVLLCWAVAVLDGFFPFLWIGYHVGMWTWKGTTIGGIVCGLKVVRVDGRPLDFSVALVRGLAAIFSFMALCIGFFWAGWTAERQSWHDKIAGTVIVKVPKGLSLI